MAVEYALDMIEVLSGLVFFLIPILLFSEMYIGISDFTGLFQRCGLGIREVGLLLVGSSIGMITDMPIIIYKETLLAINFGGAIIPILVSVMLIVKKKPNLGLVLAGTALVAVLTYITTTFDAGIGVYSMFPYYLFPSFLATAMALVIYQRDVTKGIPFAYATGTLGVLIGADLVRVPMIVVGMEESRVLANAPLAAGSIGGAGVMDLVFLAGLIAIAPLFLFARKELRRSPRVISSLRFTEKKAENDLSAADRLALQGRYREAIESSFSSINNKILLVGTRYGIQTDPYSTLEALRFHPYYLNDYYILSNAALAPAPSRADSQRAQITARLLDLELSRIEERVFATLTQRVGAFLIDFFIGGAIVLLLFITTMSISMQGSSVWVYAFIMWALMTPMVYFTVFEWLFGQTPGKRVLHIRVVTEDQERMGFMDAFTRNIVRMLDTVLFLYVISMILIATKSKHQRIGDYVARTIVMRA